MTICEDGETDHLKESSHQVIISTYNSTESLISMPFIVKEPLFSVHAAVIAINEAIDQQKSKDTLQTLKLEAAHLINVQDLPEQYQAQLYQAKLIKSENSRNKVTFFIPYFIPSPPIIIITQDFLELFRSKCRFQRILKNVILSIKKD